MAIHITSAEHLQQMFAEAGSKLVVIDFHATWCGPCKVIAPQLQTMAEEHADSIRVFKIDVDECQELAEEYGVTSMPTFIFMKDGKKLEEFAGANSTRLQATIQKYK